MTTMLKIGLSKASNDYYNTSILIITHMINTTIITPHYTFTSIMTIPTTTIPWSQNSSIT